MDLAKATYVNLAVAVLVALSLLVSLPADSFLYGAFPKTIRPVAALLVAGLPLLQLIVSGVLLVMKKTQPRSGPFWALVATCILSVGSILLFWLLVMKWHSVSIG